MKYYGITIPIVFLCTSWEPLIRQVVCFFVNQLYWSCQHKVLLDMKGCICNFAKWQIHPLISNIMAEKQGIATSLLSSSPNGCYRKYATNVCDNQCICGGEASIRVECYHWHRIVVVSPAAKSLAQCWTHLWALAQHCVVTVSTFYVYTL